MKKPSSLRIQILLIVLVAWLAPTLALGVTIQSLYFPALRAQSESALEIRASNLIQRVQGDIERLITLAKDVTYDGELTAAYSRYQSNAYTYTEFFRVTKNYLERRFARNPHILYAAFFPTNAPEQFIFTSSGYPSATFFVPHTQPYILGLGQTLDTRCCFAYRDERLFLVRNLYDTRLERFGMLVLCLNEDALFSPLTEGVAAMNGEAVVRLGEYGTDPGMDWSPLTPGLSEQQDTLSYVHQAHERDYTFDALVRQHKRVLYADMDWFMRVLTLLLMSLVPVCVLVMYYVHRRVIKPIVTLGDAADRIEQGMLGQRIAIDGPRELSQLGDAFSNMSERLKHLIDTVYKEEIALRDAQIQAMQSRINPHFLNNALELINWQARMDGDASICAMVDALSVLMNAALDLGDRRMVPLREELLIADAYFYFLAQRFGERITLTKRIDEALMDRLIPRLVIQTLLENAAEHGIAPAGGGRIALNVFLDGQFIVLNAVNTGKPPTQETLAAVSRIIAGEQASASVGLANVSERLRLIYMGRASVRLYLDDAGDTVAEIRLPNED